MFTSLKPTGIKHGSNRNLLFRLFSGRTVSFRGGASPNSHMATPDFSGEAPGSFPEFGTCFPVEKRHQTTI